jgi:uncharacterized protein YqhQ
MKKLATQKSKEQSLAVGGQALIEGVMMRDKNSMVMCVRNPKKEIVTAVEQLNPLGEKYKVLSLPFLRGIVTLFESFYLGMKSLMFSANTALEEETQGEGEDKGESVTFGWGMLAIIGVGVVGIMAVFFLLPFFLATWLHLEGIAFTIAEALIRLGMFVTYLAAIAQWGEFKRVLRYHGAEHKAINAYEAGVPLEVEHVRKYSRLHPRCGTSFLFIVLIISIVLFTLMPDYGYGWRIAYRILLIPVIAGISYELLRLSGKHRNNPVSRVLTAPGMAFQLLTTKEPSDDMLEVSIAAVKKVTEITAPEGPDTISASKRT